MKRIWTIITILFQMLTLNVNAKVIVDTSGSKGEPFRKIKGPKSLDDRIAIIGAGPAGIHMAHKLKKAGFKNITVYEKSSRIGGKSHTIYHRGTPHEMGTVYCHPDYTEIYKLVKEYRAGRILPMTTPTLWHSYNSSTTLPTYLLQLVSEIKNITNIPEALSYIHQVVKKYIELHVDLFGVYEGELMPRPSQRVLKELNITILEYLEKHDLLILKGVFQAAYTFQGYGHLEEVSALYGLMWMTPNFLRAIITPASASEKSNIKILEKGFQTLWEQLVIIDNIDVKLNHPVHKIRRSGDFQFLQFKNNSNTSDVEERFDFLIISPTLKDLENVADFNDKEQELFSRTFSAYYTTTLVDTAYSSNRGFSPQNYYLYDINLDSRMDVWVDRDSFSALNYIIGENYTTGVNVGGVDNLFIQTSVYYQYSSEKPDNATLQTKLRDHLKYQSNLTMIEQVYQDVWPYFPRFSVPDMASGVLWDIFDYQGQRNTWYIGSSVSFESAKSVVEYNNLLLRNFEVPSSKASKNNFLIFYHTFLILLCLIMT